MTLNDSAGFVTKSWFTLPLLLAVLTAMMPPKAVAATTVGSDLSADVNHSVGCFNGQPICTDWQVASTVSGVVVRWRVKRTGFLGGAMRLRVIRPLGGTDYVSVGSSAYENSFAAGISQFSTRLSIKSGEYIGLDRFSADGAQDVFHNPGGPYTEWSFPGSSPVQDNVTTSTSFTSTDELLLNADIEADSDGDGYGDESQDMCPSDPGTQGTCPASPTPADTTPPQLSKVSLTKKAFRTKRAKGKKRSRKGKAKKRTTFKYELSEDATVVFTIERATWGRKVAGSCKKLSRRNRRKPRCKRYWNVGAFSAAGKLGVNRKRFSGKVGSRRLSPGRYRATLVATDAAGNKSSGKTVSFRILRGG